MDYFTIHRLFKEYSTTITDEEYLTIYKFIEFLTDHMQKEK